MLRRKGASDQKKQKRKWDDVTRDCPKTEKKKEKRKTITRFTIVADERKELATQLGTAAAKKRRKGAKWAGVVAAEVEQELDLVGAKKPRKERKRVAAAEEQEEVDPMAAKNQK